MKKVFLCISLLSLLPIASSPASARELSSPQVKQPRPGVITTTDRAAVIAAFETEYNRAEPAMEWTGDVSTCNGGTTSVAYQQSILQRVNWFRGMA